MSFCNLLLKKKLFSLRYLTVVNGLYRLPLLVLISYKGNVKTKIVSNGEEEGKGVKVLHAF